MKLKALLCAGLMLAASIIIPSEVYAETTYASASELITDAIEVAVTGVTSPTYDTAISNMQGKITMSGDMVSYDGTPIGYWYSDDSDTIWSDSGRTSTVLTPTDDGVWEFKPTVLRDILTDFNNDLIENIVPTTEDWSKIIGKYDVTLGNGTIPAAHWIDLTPSSDPLSSRDVYYATQNYTHTLGINQDAWFIGIWGISADGGLWLQNNITSIGSYNNTYQIHTGSLSVSGASGMALRDASSLTAYGYVSDRPYVKIGIRDTYTDNSTNLTHDLPHLTIYTTN